MNTIQALMPLLVLFTSLLAAPIIFLLPDESRTARTIINLAAAIIKLVLVSGMFLGVYLGVNFEIAFTVVGDLRFILRADALGLMFAGLSSLLWLFTTIYAVGYLEDSSNRSRFFGFFSICVASTLGIALAGNLFTFILFYELLTLSTYPLVVHRGTSEVLAAGNRYLQYTLTGGAVLLLGIVALHALAGDPAFGDRARLAALPEAARPHLMVIFVLLIAGLAVKAAMVPFHGWLPVAMVAPAPVSALLHAVAVVKAGAFGIIRVVYDVYGLDFAHFLGLLYPLTIASAITILYGSARALTQISIKRRLAFSTVSQVSYIIIAVSLFHPMGVAAGLVHLIHQGLMKVTLFFCAGNYAQTLGIHDVDELDGTGRRMPLTSAAFTVAALGMIGVPPVAGFITKWYLGMGAAGAGTYWVILVIAVSGMLNAAYYLPMLYRIWFKERKNDWPSETPFAPLETSAWLLYPTLATAFLSCAAGLLAGLPFSPARWAAEIAIGEFLP
jgi:multicomponent Na+:H+ antiporter subunit D